MVTHRPTPDSAGRAPRRARSAPRSPARIFRAIADPTRRTILDSLCHAADPAAPGAGWTAGHIARMFTVSRPAVSRHLGVLRRAGLVRETRRGRERIYSLDPRPLMAVDDWLTAYRLRWAAALISLKEFVESGPQAPPRATRPHTPGART